MFTPQKRNPALAAIFVSAATAFIAATMLLAKALTSDAWGTPLHPMQVSFGRFFFAFLTIATALVMLRPQLTRVHWPLHLARTFSGWVGVTLMFASVAFIPLADATAITFLNPVFGMILAIPLLGERVGRWRWIAAAIAFAGATILLRPTPASFQPAALLALGAAAVMGLELTFIKKLAGRETPIQILFFNNLLGCIIASCAVIFVWQALSPAQWGLLALLGIMMAAAQTCFVNGMARADASFAAPFSYATLVFAALYDVLFYDVIPDRVTLLGAGIIIAGAFLLAWREALARRV